MQLFVGLGNPGAAYEQTRHNVGFWWVSAWLALEGIHPQHEPRFRGQTAHKKNGAQTLRWLLPQTFMNLCGESVGALARFYQIPPAQILVAHDELDLPAGVARLKFGGGHAGHNGLKSIEHHLGTRDFWRLRLGIGRPSHTGHDTADYVLGKPTNAETVAIMQSIDDSLDISPLLLRDEMEKARQWLHSTTEERERHSGKNAKKPRTTMTRVS